MRRWRKKNSSRLDINTNSTKLKQFTAAAPMEETPFSWVSECECAFVCVWNAAKSSCSIQAVVLHVYWWEHEHVRTRNIFLVFFLLFLLAYFMLVRTVAFIVL